MDNIEKRLDRIEVKLDIHLKQSEKNDTDLKWVKGFIKYNMMVTIAVVGAAVTYIFSTIN